MRQRLGQHFLVNEEAVGVLISSLGITAGEVVLEIGPGRGVLTGPLVDECKKNGARLVVVEKDELLARELKDRYSAAALDVVVGDIRIELSGLVASFGKTPYLLVGNIPYYLTGHLLALVGELPHRPRKAIFTVQEEVANRVAALPPQMNRLAAAVQVWATPRILMRLSENDFSPPPEVRSAIIMLTALADAPQGDRLRKYYAVMRALFSQPRKTIENNLLGLAGVTRETIRAALAGMDLIPTARPQDLSIENIKTIEGSLGDII